MVENDLAILRELANIQTDWNGVVEPFHPLGEQSEWNAKSNVTSQIVDLYVGRFGRVAQQIVELFPNAFGNEPKRPADAPADKIFDWGGQASYDVQDRALVLFGTDDRFRAGLRCLLWAAVANSPTTFNVVEDVQLAIKHWTENLTTRSWMVQKGNPFVWRSQGRPMQWAIDAAKQLFDGRRKATDQGPPVPGASENGDRAGKSCAEILNSLPACVRQAYIAYELVESMNGKRLEDQEAYDYLYENGLPENAGDFGELSDYELPVFDTWARYLRGARQALGEQKYNRGSGRRKGRSVANADEVERREWDK